MGQEIRGRLDAGLFGELAAGGLLEVLVGANEATGKGPGEPVRVFVSLDEHDLQSLCPDGEDDDVGSDGERGKGVRIVVLSGGCHTEIVL